MPRVVVAATAESAVRQASEVAQASARGNTELAFEALLKPGPLESVGNVSPQCPAVHAALVRLVRADGFPCPKLTRCARASPWVCRPAPSCERLDDVPVFKVDQAGFWKVGQSLMPPYAARKGNGLLPLRRLPVRVIG